MKKHIKNDGPDIFDTLRLVAIVASVLVIVIGGLLLMPGPGKWIGEMFGPGEIPVIDFADLVLTGETDEYLECPLDICLSAEPHAEAREYDLTATQLRDALLKYLDLQPNVKMLGFDPVHQQFDFSDQDPTMRLPDIITFQIVEISDTRSTLAIYSRSVSGFGREGSNERRVNHWLSMMESD